ncbi:ribulose-phosphate 3-epimerase [Candidatus Woesearchaeota archaeon]|nr:ribulose-phosphate 3-epimerase [Candidatus Woesearchaeota archaeon]
MRKIIPAVLEKSFAKVMFRIKQFEKVSNAIQIDIADGKFVKNKTIGLKDIPKIKSKSNLEYHLMVRNPEEYIKKIKKAGFIAVHCEVKGFEKALDMIKKRKISAGVAINPKTDVKKLKPVIKKIRKVIVMTVNPGKQGAKFLPNALKKIKQIKKMHKNIIIQVDGGISEQTIDLAKKAGADEFVVGSALVNSDNIKEKYRSLKRWQE